MPLYKVPKGAHRERLAAQGYMHDNPEALTPVQRECANRFAIAMQMEQEAYLTKHPEISVMLKLFVSKVTSEYIKGKGQVDVIKEAGEFFTRPLCVLDGDIRHYLRLDAKEPFVKETKPVYNYDGQHDLEKDLLSIVTKHNPPELWDTATTPVPTPDTLSSSFISIITSATTLPTPETIPTPEPTIHEIFFGMISNAVDKAIYSRVTDEMLRYDTAYVELMNRVEEVMEIPVQGVKDDLAALLYNAYHYFELVIMEKENIAARVAWEKRMRKKLKTTLRRSNNFKGYETPPTPKSSISSHESYLKPPMKPCICSPQFCYNRYKKDRFGIWLPRGEFRTTNITQTPVFSSENVKAGNLEADKTAQEKDRSEAKLSRSELRTTNITVTSAVSTEPVKEEDEDADKTAQDTDRVSAELSRGERRSTNITLTPAVSSKSLKEDGEEAEKTTQEKVRASIEQPRRERRTTKKRSTLAVSSRNIKEEVGEADSAKEKDRVSTELPSGERRSTNITPTPAVSLKNVQEEAEKTAQKKDRTSTELPHGGRRSTSVTSTPAVSSKNVTEEVGEAEKTTQENVDVQDVPSVRSDN